MTRFHCRTRRSDGGRPAGQSNERRQPAGRRRAPRPRAPRRPTVLRLRRSSTGPSTTQPAPAGGDLSLLHRRFDRLTGSWVLISPSRNARPGRDRAARARTVLAHCAQAAPSCRGRSRWPCSTTASRRCRPTHRPRRDRLTAAPIGRCQVVVYTPDHVQPFARPTCRAAQLIELVAVLRERTGALWDDGYDYVMAFENRGAAVGATLGHLHGQLYAFGHLPPTIRTKLAQHEAPPPQTSSAASAARSSPRTSRTSDRRQRDVLGRRALRPAMALRGARAGPARTVSDA